MNEINIFKECKDIDFNKDHITQLINLSLDTTKYNQVKINLIFCDNDKLNSFKQEYFDDGQIKSDKGYEDNNICLLYTSPSPRD